MIKQKTENKLHTIDDTLLIPVLSSGDKIYHYTTVEGLMGICNGEFWVTERGFLNDYMEFQIATDILEEVLDKHMSDKGKYAQIVKAIRDEVVRLQAPGLRPDDVVAYCGDYVISFSLDWDSPLMWSEYSDFTGYCMEFDFERLLKSFPKEGKGVQH